MANSYTVSSHFKCSMCKEKEKFVKEAATFGIYIPTKDIEWEHTKVKPLIFYKTNLLKKTL